MNTVVYESDKYLAVKVDKGNVELKAHKSDKDKMSICQVKCIIPSELISCHLTLSFVKYYCRNDNLQLRAKQIPCSSC